MLVGAVSYFESFLKIEITGAKSVKTQSYSYSTRERTHINPQVCALRCGLS